MGIQFLFSGCHVVQAGLAFTKQLTFPDLPSVGIVDMCCRVQFHVGLGLNSGFYVCNGAAFPAHCSQSFT